MKLHELRIILNAHPGKQFCLVLPGEKKIPVSFHVTEVGYVHKNYIDCGGKTHSRESCQLQVWLGPDEDHRLSTDKLAAILELAKGIVPGDDLDVEVEYEDTILSQYPVAGHTVSNEAVTLQLTTKHTACLAPQLCMAPSVSISCGCAPSACC